MPLFAVDGDGVPLGLAATPNPSAAIALIGALCRAQDRLTDRSELRRFVALSVRRPTLAEEGKFKKSSLEGAVRLAGILVEPS